MRTKTKKANVKTSLSLVKKTILRTFLTERDKREVMVMAGFKSPRRKPFNKTHFYDVLKGTQENVFIESELIKMYGKYEMEIIKTYGDDSQF